jgi:hypothetical protein
MSAALVSHLSFAFASRIVSHCQIRDRIGTATGKRQHMVFDVAGVGGTYRPKGQTSRLKALVRHGAGAGLALAGVLEVSAQDIRVTQVKALSRGRGQRRTPLSRRLPGRQA